MEDDTDALSCYSENEIKNYRLPETGSVLIQIEDYKLQKTGLKQFVIYKISGSDHIGTFVVHRRYKEFKRLREVLCGNWLGCVVPALPKKKWFVFYIQGNCKIEFIEKRKKLLEHFLINISEMDYLYLDEYFQIFLRNNEGFAELCKDFVPLDFLGLAKKYQSAFAHVDCKLKDESKLAEMTELCDSNLKVLKEFKNDLVFSERSFLRFLNSHQIFYKEIDKIAAQLREAKINEREEKDWLKNPYRELIFIVKFLVKDVESLKESAEKYFNISKSIECLEGQISEYLNLIDGFQAGRKSILTIKSKADALSGIEKVYCDLKANKAYLEVIAEQINNLIHFQAGIFKTRHLEAVNRGIRNLSETLISNYENFASDALNLEIRLNF